MSCVEGKVLPPQISHGRVMNFERRRKGEKVFLVAYFSCNPNYQFEQVDGTMMYCSNLSWVGNIPTCLPLVDYTGDVGEGEGEGEGDDDGEFDEYDIVENNNDEEPYEYEEERDLGENEPPPPPPPPATDETSPSSGGQPQAAVAQNPKPEPEIVIQINESSTDNVEPDAEVLEHKVESTKESEVITHQESEVETVQANAEQEEPVPETTTQKLAEKSSKDPYEPTLLGHDCGQDNAGCAQICNQLLYPDENEPVYKCDCKKGYTLDLKDYTSCLGKWL